MRRYQTGSGPRTTTKIICVPGTPCYRSPTARAASPPLSARAAGNLRPQLPAAQQDKTAGRAELPHRRNKEHALKRFRYHGRRRDLSLGVALSPHPERQKKWPRMSSRPRPSLLEWVVLISVARLAGELPAMVVRGHRVGKGQGQAKNDDLWLGRTMWRWLERRSRVRRAKTICALIPVMSRLFGQYSARSPRPAQRARDMRPKSLMVGNCQRPNGLHTQTDGSGFGMRSYRRIKSQIGDWAKTVLLAGPPMTLGNMAQAGGRGAPCYDRSLGKRTQHAEK